MKKIIALVLALVMVLSLGTVAFAKHRMQEAIVFPITGMLYAPAQKLAAVLEMNSDKLEAEVNAVAAQVDAQMTYLQTSVANAVKMANGLIYAVASAYQVGGEAILAVASIVDENFKQNVAARDSKTFSGWIARCVENSMLYEETGVLMLAEFKKQVDKYVDGIQNWVGAAKDEDYEGSEVGQMFGLLLGDFIETITDPTEYLAGDGTGDEGQVYEFVEDTLRVIVNFFNGNHKQPD